MTHSLISPSDAGVWRYCTGYPTMKLIYPRSNTPPAAQAGSDAHEKAAALIHKNQLTGHTYADNVLTEFKDQRNVLKGVEVILRCPAIHPESYGTCDAYFKSIRKKHIIVWDYKTGHIPIEAYENWQLINYAASLYEPGFTIDLRIVQKDKIRNWRPDNLPDYISELSAAAYEVYSSDATCRTGAHCRYCEARHDCTPARKAALQLFEATGRPLPAGRTIDDLADELTLINRAIDSLQFIRAAYEDKISSAITSGLKVNGWRLGSGPGKLVWDKPDEEISALGDIMGFNLRKSGLITPTQAIDAGLPEVVVKPYTKHKKPALRLVPDNDGREIFKDG